LFIHLSCDGHLDHVHFLAIVNSASVNIGMQKENVGEEKNEKIYLMHIAFQIYKMKISADWLHYRENILNTNKMYT